MDNYEVIVKEIISLIADQIATLETKTSIEDKAAEHELCILIRKICEKYKVDVYEDAYDDVIANFERFKKDSEVWDAEVVELLKDVDTEDDDG